jgi:hypothetical protein
VLALGELIEQVARAAVERGLVGHLVGEARRELDLSGVVHVQELLRHEVRIVRAARPDEQAPRRVRPFVRELFERGDARLDGADVARVPVVRPVEAIRRVARADDLRLAARGGLALCGDPAVRLPGLVAGGLPFGVVALGAGAHRPAAVGRRLEMTHVPLARVSHAVACVAEVLAPRAHAF